MPPEDSGKQRDFVLAPNEFMFVQDRGKGQLQVQVGPITGTLQAGNEPISYDSRTRRFVQAGNVLAATQAFPSASEGSYIVLENPSIDDKKLHPELGNVSNFLTQLDMGRKINIPGPKTFPLWPGQVAAVIPGHQLRTNEYLVVRVYNEDAARTNWKSAIVKSVGAPVPVPPGQGGGEAGQASPAPAAPAVAPESVVHQSDMTMGKLIVIRGDEVSFYIPPTGLEVVQDENGSYIREALTLERLEHCILLSESGEKRYERGPQVVFPGPTETFIGAANGTRKFRAIELNDDMGLYVKVTADYTEEDGTTRKVGEELFITGKEQRLYFPRAEHKLIKYGDKEIHFGIAIPKGEARYVLNKLTGSVELVKGPQIFLPDPRNQVIARRGLSDEQVRLLYPGNKAALEYNEKLRTMQQQRGAVAEQPLDDATVRAYLGRTQARGTRQAVAESAVEAYGGGSIDRGSTYTPPRTITLDTKFDGAVSINIWNGYAVMIADKAGRQRVEVGPKTILLEYDEYPVVLTLSTGKPKSTDTLVQTVYLRVLYNHVTDIVDVITNDDVHASVKVVWRVNFEGEPANWFAVENYVKFLCDRTRSILRGVAKRLSIQELSQGYIPVIRNAVLGEKPDGKERSGLRFAENGVRIYDVEISELVIGDRAIAEMLLRVQTESVTRAISLAKQDREYKDTLLAEDLKRKTAEAVAETDAHVASLATKKTEVIEDNRRKAAVAAAFTREHAARLAMEDLERAEIAKRHSAQEAGATAEESAALEAKRIKRDAELAGARHELVRQQQSQQAEIDELRSVLESELQKARLERVKAEREQSLEFERKGQELKLAELKAETAAAVERFKSFSPELTAALQSFGTRDVASKLADAVAPIALREGISVSDALVRIFKGTVLEKVLDSVAAQATPRS